MNKSYRTILFGVEDQVATVTINRPDKLNALNGQVLDELKEVFKTIENRDDILGVFLTGAGQKAFVAGADIRELSELDEKSGEKVSRKGQKVFKKIENLRKPVIAVVNGYALGGGAELAMACHMRVAATKAVFGQPEVGLGLIPGYGGTQRLTRLVGRTRAMEMILTGEPIQADQALEFGLVNRVVEKENLMDEAEGLMNAILGNSPVAVGNAIAAIYAVDGDREDGFENEASLFGKSCGTEDFTEGTSAFLEKRKPEFTGK